MMFPDNFMSTKNIYNLFFKLTVYLRDIFFAFPIPGEVTDFKLHKKK